MVKLDCEVTTRAMTHYHLAPKQDQHIFTDFLNISRVIIVSVFTHICTVLIF